MNNIEKINQIFDRSRELFEQKYTRKDWETNVKGTRAYFNKCREQAINEICKPKV
jgi:hypothetical protein